MKLFLYLSDFIVPFLILAIIVYESTMGINALRQFYQLCKERFPDRDQDPMPTLIGLMVAVVFSVHLDSNFSPV